MNHAVSMHRATIALALLLLCGGLFAADGVQAAPAAPDTPQVFSASVSVGYVLIPFVATDSKGRPLKTLRQKDINLLVDGVKVKTDLFDRTDTAPVSFTILLDVSGSMGLAGKMEGALSALGSLVDSHVVGDEYSLYTFSEGRVRQLVPFTEEGTEILVAASRIKPWGKTAFFDALLAMRDKTLEGKNGSRAIILVTDGIDNASIASLPELTPMLEGVDVPVYPVGLLSNEAATAEKNSESRLDLGILAQIADASGGRLAVAQDPAELKSAIRSIQDDLRSQYLIGFTPTGQGGVKYRRIALELPRSVRTIRVRRGYRGTDPPPLEASRVARNQGKKGSKG